MKDKLTSWLGLAKQSDFVRNHLTEANMHAVTHMCAIVIGLEVWMILSLAQYLIEKAQAGTPRDFPWIVEHGGWYVMLLTCALIMLIYAQRFLHGKAKSQRVANMLLVLFSIACLAFGIHYGQNSYAQGEQVLAFVTMTLFVFGLLVWKSTYAIVASIATFLGFYIILDNQIPVTYGTQVNLFTLWISTFVVSLSSFKLHLSEGEKEEELTSANTKLRKNEEALTAANTRLHKLADYDELTDIPNLHTFRHATRVNLENFKNYENITAHFTILFIDIENFKSYGQKYGYSKGDEFLHDFAQGLEKIFENELVARLSDDHFAALCELEVVDERADAAAKLLHDMKEGVRMHLKVGAYQITSEDSSVTQAIDKARIACNSIKRKSFARVAFYDEAMQTQTERRTYIINNIKRAVREGWIEAFYQPVVDCSGGTGKLIGYEALARWRDPNYGLLPPFVFIETLEEYREIDRLDRCIIEQVCQHLREELDAGKNPVPVSLNFSRLDFELYDVCDFLCEMSDKYQVPPALLDVEITESALSEQMGALQDSMRRLHEAGFSLWLDDFGSGYSSLNVLKDFQFDVRKIDMAFLRGFPDNPKAAPVVASSCTLAQTLGLTTLCEGVETKEQFDFLNSIGCNRAQGYFFGKPEPQKAQPTPL